MTALQEVMVIVAAMAAAGAVWSLVLARLVYGAATVLARAVVQVRADADK